MGIAGVRFSDVLAERERADVERRLGSAGATATSWGVAANRTYAVLDLTPGAALADLRARLPDAVIACPPRVVLRVVPHVAHDVARLQDVLAGSGGFVGVTFAATEPTALVIEVDVQLTPLSAILALIDVELGANRRRIEAILPLDDDTLTALAGAILREPELCDASRLVETHLACVLASGRV